MLVGMTAWIFLMRILASVSNEAVAGFHHRPAHHDVHVDARQGLSNAAATLVGQNLGAGQPERAESSVWKIGFYNMAFMIFVSVIFSSGTSADRAVHRRSGRDCHRRRLAANPVLFLFRVWLVDGVDAGIQRRG